MKISDLASLQTLTCLQEQYTDAEITAGYTSDLLSDVMGNAEEHSVLITIQAHKNTVAVSSLAGVSAMIICNNRPCPEDMLEAARDEGIAVFRTSENQFQTSALIAQQLG
ncbi:DRTGG domain-containing protein [Pontiella sp.]|uniref:DRTGG domain-containing protein n=1 Tax=Pontiella sp. TaxID=2837462 RepID=UPI00356316D0